MSLYYKIKARKCFVNKNSTTQRDRQPHTLLFIIARHTLPPPYTCIPLRAKVNPFTKSAPPHDRATTIKTKSQPVVQEPTSLWCAPTRGITSHECARASRGKVRAAAATPGFKVRGKIWRPRIDASSWLELLLLLLLLASSCLPRRGSTQKLAGEEAAAAAAAAPHANRE